MSDMKCPFCQQKLKELYNNGDSVGFRCKNKNCPETNIMCGTKALWQELIHTHKALDIAWDGLKELNENAFLTEYAQHVIDKALKQIRALKQKDVK